MNGNNKQDKYEPEDNFLAINYGEKKQYKNYKLFKVTRKKCGKYGHIASDFWVNENNGNDNRNTNKNNRKPQFNGECNNCRERSHREVGCRGKNKKKKMTSKTSLWVPNSVEKYHKTKENKFSKNC